MGWEGGSERMRGVDAMCPTGLHRRPFVCFCDSRLHLKKLSRIGAQAMHPCCQRRDQELQSLHAKLASPLPALATPALTALALADDGSQPSTRLAIEGLSGTCAATPVPPYPRNNSASDTASSVVFTVRRTLGSCHRSVPTYLFWS